MNAQRATPGIYGLLAEFEDTPSLVAAAAEVRRRGYVRVDGYTPFPVEGLAEALGMQRTRMPYVVLLGALIGGLAGFALQYWISVVEYPLNIGGRPLNSWPSFIPVTFEMTILGGALFAVLGMLGLNGLPRPHHPLFAIEDFARTTTDRYFLCIEAQDAQFHETSTRQVLEELGAIKVWDVPAE